MAGKGTLAMKKIAAILALAFALTIGMTLTTAFAFGVLPRLSTAPCFIATNGTPHFVAILASLMLARLPVLVPDS